MPKKNSTSFIVIIAMCFIFLFSCSYDESPNGDVNILDVRNTQEPSVNLSAHKPYDVEVYRNRFLFDGYKVRYYQLENNKLVSHEATHESALDLDKATYVWMSDTSVAIRLYNDSTNQQLKFKVFGNGPRSGISDKLR